MCDVYNERRAIYITHQMCLNATESIVLFAVFEIKPCFIRCSVSYK